MCGIAGILQFEPQAGHDEMRHWAEGMAAAMEHRGPDDAGVWVSDDARCSLSHRRLSIIDLSAAGRQPMLSADGKAVITFNGEIYNYRELRPELEACGRRLQTRTDTEVLLEAIREWGALAFTRLDGMYAFAQYDLERRELWLARDPFGEKPLYLLNDGKRFAFASELQALQTLPFFDDTVSEEAMAEFLAFQYVGAPRTLYRSVEKLPPGCSARVSRDGRTTLQRYFEFRPGVDPARAERSLDDLADELEDILVRLLRRRLISDVPLGAFLSGGVDSSTVCALVRRKLDVPLETFSVGWLGSAESEHEQARRFAEHLGTTHHEQTIAPDATDFLLHAGDHLDEPNGDSSCLPVYLLSAFARKRVTVAISGDGGDEMFGGYGRYFGMLRRRRRAHRRGRASDVGRRYYGGDGMVLFFDDDDLRDLFGRVPGALGERLDRLRREVDLDHGSADLLMRLRKTDVDHYLPGAVLAKVDRMSMQHSLEVRTPFLSLELARFSERLPSSVLYREKRGKALLKHLAERYLPREWLDVPKRGFGLPMREGWGHRELLDTVASSLQREDSAVAGVLGRDRVARFLERQRDPARTHTYQLWAIGILESYLHRRPAQLPAHREALPLRRAEVPAVHPVSARLSAATGAPKGEVVLFCRDAVPDWWRGLPGCVTVTGPFAAAADEGVRYLQSDWTSEPPKLLALEGRVGQGATAVLAAPGAMAAATPALAERLLALGFEQLAIAEPDDTGSPIFALGPYCEFARACRAAWLPPGRRVGGFRRGIRPDRGLAFRWRSPLVAKVTAGGRQPESLALVEDRTPLLAAASVPEDVRDFGRGRYGVEAKRLWLSSSDGSAPGRNRRRYAVVDLGKRKRVPWWHSQGGDAAEATHREAVAAWIEGDAADAAAAAPRPGDTVALVVDTLFAGGAERQWVSLGRGLVARGTRVVLFAFDLAGENAHYLRLAQDSAIEVRELGGPRSPLDRPLAAGDLDPRAVALVAGAPAYLRRNLWRLVRELRAIDADYVACQLDVPNLVGGLAGLLAGARRVLVSFRNVNPSHFSYLDEPWLRDAYRSLMRSPRVVLSGNSQAGNDDYAAWLGIEPGRIATVHNGFSPELFLGPEGADPAALRRELDIGSDALVVSGLFRLSDEKDPETFLAVCRRILAAREDVVVVQAGGGPRLSELRGQVARQGLGGRVHLLGRRGDSAAILGASDLLLSTSRFEGLSNALLEAQYLGVPVVATAAGGTPEAIEDGVSGLLAPVGDADAITRACLALLGDPDRRARLGAAGRRRVEERFSSEAMVEAILGALGPG